MTAHDDTSDRRGADVALIAQVAVLQSSFQDMRSDIQGVVESMKTLQGRIERRPSWAVTTFITVSTGLNVGLVTALVYQVGGG